MTGGRRHGPSAQPRSAARLAAVQALYSWEMSGTSADTLLEDVLEHGIGRKAAGDGAEEDVLLAPPDELLLAALLKGAVEKRESLDEMVAGALSADWPAERLEAVLRAILRVGAYELLAMPQTPAKVVISEYLDIAHAFYSGPEPKLVNAVLDRIAQVVRQEELGGHAAG